MLSIYEIIMFVGVLIFCAISLVYIAFRTVGLLVELFQENIVKRYFPRFYYYDWEEEI